jgi:hypothetical protein
VLMAEPAALRCSTKSDLEDSLSSNDDRTNDGGATTPRRVYTPPRIEESGRFEQLVLTCSVQQGTCSTRGPGGGPLRS